MKNENRDAVDHVRRSKVGSLPVDSVTLDEALGVIERLISAGEGGAVFTPNVDHVVLAEDDSRMRQAYSRVSLSLVDGMPLVWASHLLNEPLPEKVSGSDFVPRLLERAAERSWRVYFLGGASGIAERARDNLRERLPQLQVVGIEAPRIDLADPSAAWQPLVDRIRGLRPDLVLVALGAPKQEIWIDSVRDRLRPAVLLGIGATLDFVAGALPRAPGWMSKWGLEWLFRLRHEPRRLWRRYLLRDPRFALILGRDLRQRALNTKRM